jgi:hypothetical protein
MACNEDKYKSIFDINRYKIHIRDTQFSDDEIYTLIKDVFIEIASETRIFKDTFAFSISKNESVYNIREMYDVFQYYNDEPTIDFVETMTVDSLIEEDAKNILINPTLDPKGLHSTSDDVCYNDYKHLIDLAYYNKDTRRIDYVRNKWFQMITPDEYQLTLELSDKEQYDIICLVSIIPNINNVDANVERVLRRTVIDGIKYYASSAYMNVSNEQVTNLLYQRYYNSRKQLTFEYSNYISDGLISNPSWNY